VRRPRRPTLKRITEPYSSSACGIDYDHCYCHERIDHTLAALRLAVAQLRALSMDYPEPKAANDGAEAAIILRLSRGY
jgi:hypothetical protein